MSLVWRILGIGSMHAAPQAFDVVGAAVRAIERGDAFRGYSPFLVVLIEQRQVRLPLVPDHLPAREAADRDDHLAFARAFAQLSLSN